MMKSIKLNTCNIPLAILCLVMLSGIFAACDDDGDKRTGEYSLKLYLDSARVATIEGLVKDLDIPRSSISYEPSIVMLRQGYDGLRYLYPFQVGAGDVTIQDDKRDYTIHVVVTTEGSDVSEWVFSKIDVAVECDDGIRQEIMSDLEEGNLFTGVNEQDEYSDCYMTFRYTNPYIVFLSIPNGKGKGLRFYYDPSSEKPYQFHDDEDWDRKTSFSFELLDKYDLGGGRVVERGFAKKGVFHLDETDYYQSLYGAGKVKSVKIDYEVVTPSYLQ